jgi:hypothetical protein
MVDLRKYYHFVQRGGKIEYALDALINVCNNIHTTKGDDGWMYDLYQDEIEAHPATPLDSFYDLARLKCFEINGNLILHPRGPYNHNFDDDTFN